MKQADIHFVKGALCLLVFHNAETVVFRILWIFLAGCFFAACLLDLLKGKRKQ